jgi:hypothetical protein
MRKHLPLAVLLLAAFLMGCGGPATPTDRPSDVVVEPTDTSVPTEVPTEVPSPTIGQESGGEPTAASSEPAACVQASAEFPPLQGLPPVSEEDHIKGSADARITLIEYSDFQ